MTRGRSGHAKLAECSVADPLWRRAGSECLRLRQGFHDGLAVDRENGVPGCDRLPLRAGHVRNHQPIFDPIPGEQTKVALASSHRYIPVTIAGALTPITHIAPAHFSSS